MTTLEKILAGLCAAGAVLGAVLGACYLSARAHENAAQAALSEAQASLAVAQRAQDVGAKVATKHTATVSQNAKDKEQANAALAEASQKAPDWANERVPDSVLSVLRDN